MSEEPQHRRGRERTDEEWAALTVGTWARTVPVNHGVCGTCGQPVVYNLAAKVVGHTADAVDPCEWPWPGEPMPDYVKAEIEFWRRGAEVFDRWLSGQPTVSAPALGVLSPAEQADRRRAEADALLAANPPMVESVTERLRRTHAKQQARRAERAGRLDVGGAA